MASTPRSGVQVTRGPFECVSSSLSLAIAGPFENPMEVLDQLPRENAHRCKHLHMVLCGSQPIIGCPRGPWAPGEEAQSERCE